VSLLFAATTMIVLANCGSSDSTSARPTDGSVEGGGSWGPCSLAAAGHPSATVSTPRMLGAPVSDRYGIGSCDRTQKLFASAAEYAAFEVARHPDAGTDSGTTDADVGTDAAPPFSDLVDWSKESVLVIVDLSSAAFTFGTEGDAIVVAQGAYCQGQAPQCTETAYAVPKPSRIVTAICPRPSEPCLAP